MSSGWLCQGNVRCVDHPARLPLQIAQSWFWPPHKRSCRNLSVCTQSKCSCWAKTHSDFSRSGRFAERTSFDAFCWQVRHKSVIGLATTTLGWNCSHNFHKCGVANSLFSRFIACSFKRAPHAHFHVWRREQTNVIFFESWDSAG